MADDAKSRKDFIPSAEQLAIVELLINPEDLRSNAKKCAQVGIAESTLWRWRQDPEFNKYLVDRVHKYTDSAVADGYMAVIRKMKMGDVAAAKLFFELRGEIKQKHEVSGPKGGPLQSEVRNVVCWEGETIDNAAGSAGNQSNSDPLPAAISPEHRSPEPRKA